MFSVHWLQLKVWAHNHKYEGKTAYLHTKNLLIRRILSILANY